MNTIEALDLANYFIYKTGHPVVQYKLHKLLFLAQGFHLAIFGKPLINSTFLPLVNGPGIIGLFKFFEEGGLNAYSEVSLRANFDSKLISTKLSEEQLEQIDSFWEVYGPLSDETLQLFIAEQGSYKNARIGVSQSDDSYLPISEAEMAANFKENLINVLETPKEDATTIKNWDSDLNIIAEKVKDLVIQ